MARDATPSDIELRIATIDRDYNDVLFRSRNPDIETRTRSTRQRRIAPHPQIETEGAAAPAHGHTHERSYPEGLVWRDTEYPWRERDRTSPPPAYDNEQSTTPPPHPNSPPPPYEIPSNPPPAYSEPTTAQAPTGISSWPIQDKIRFAITVACTVVCLLGLVFGGLMMSNGTPFTSSVGAGIGVLAGVGLMPLVISSIAAMILVGNPQVAEGERVCRKSATTTKLFRDNRNGKRGSTTIRSFQSNRRRERSATSTRSFPDTAIFRPETTATRARTQRSHASNRSSHTKPCGLRAGPQESTKGWRIDKPRTFLSPQKQEKNHTEDDILQNLISQ